MQDTDSQIPRSPIQEPAPGPNGQTPATGGDESVDPGSINKHLWERSYIEMPVKSRFLAKQFVCNKCGTQGMDLSPEGAKCRGCGEEYHRVNNAINMLSDDMKVEMNIEETDNVSARNVYDGNAHVIINHTIGGKGMVLDCGAGKRQFRNPHLIQLEVVPYDNIDVLAVNQKIPFADNCFDAVLSMDVLEHVNDPVASMQEIARVLKPGGLLYLDIPFLQAEHGYPHHYFNATRMGVQQLVRGLLETEAHVVPISGQPIQTLQQILDVYARNLPEDLREKFRNMTVGELTEGSIQEWLGRDIVARFPVEARWLLASTTQGIFRKPVSDGSVTPATCHTLKAKMLPAYQPNPKPKKDDGTPRPFDPLLNRQV